MGNIQDLLAQILSARYGRDVRQSIHDAIETCYEDGHAGAIDLEARTLLGDTDISGISETVTGAVVELGESVETAQTTADGKLAPADAWKIGRIETTETVTIEPLANYRFSAAIPSGQTNIIILNARSSDASRTLVPINLYTTTNTMNALMSNQRASAYTDEAITIQFTYAYK